MNRHSPHTCYCLGRRRSDRLCRGWHRPAETTARSSLACRCHWNRARRTRRTGRCASCRARCQPAKRPTRADESALKSRRAEKHGRLIGHCGVFARSRHRRCRRCRQRTDHLPPVSGPKAPSTHPRSLGSSCAEHQRADLSSTAAGTHRNS